MSCFVLHNVAKTLNDPEFEEDELEEEDIPHSHILLDEERRGTLRDQGQALRNNVVEIISNLSNKH